MAIYSRRAIQSLINCSGEFLTEPQVRKIVGSLNLAGATVIPWEWEIVLLSALGRMGKVAYEQAIGRSRPDVLFSLRGSPMECFVAEIATVSDKFTEKENPADKFCDVFVCLVERQGLAPNTFSVYIGDNQRDRLGGNTRFRLKLPMEHEFMPLVFNSAFNSFLQGIKASPNENWNFQVATSRVDVSIHYRYEGDVFSWRHSSYHARHSATKNTLYRALESKADQLRESGYVGPKGIFLCDGGCYDLMNIGKTADDRAEAVIGSFLEKHPSICFVQGLGVQDDFNMHTGAARFSVQSRVYEGQNFNAMSQKLREILRDIAKHIPLPEMDAKNARRAAKGRRNNVGRSFYGRFSMQHPKINISARGVLDLLAGKVEQRQFMLDHGLLYTSPSGSASNLFERMLGDGQMITGVEVERCPEKDDDWLVITFSDPDPAISKFVYPKGAAE